MNGGDLTAIFNEPRAPPSATILDPKPPKKAMHPGNPNHPPPLRVNGGKGGSGVYQRIISLMPAHEVYIETHLGAGHILRRKRPARQSYAVEIDGEVLQAFTAGYGGRIRNTEFINQDCLQFLVQFPFTGSELVYADPPYLVSSRRSPRRLYRHEYTERDHRRLLAILLDLPCHVMLSGYENPLYAETLSGWQTVSFNARTRGGPAVETLWLNYDPDRVLKHDYRHTGVNYRERERIRKKAGRWAARLKEMPADERNYLLQVIASRFNGEVCFHAESTMLAPPAGNGDIAGEPGSPGGIDIHAGGRPGNRRRSE